MVAFSMAWHRWSPSGAPCSPTASVADHAAHDAAAVHGGEGVVHVVEADLTGDQAGQVEAPRLPQGQVGVEVGADAGRAVDTAEQLLLRREELARAERDHVLGAAGADRDHRAAAAGDVPGPP